MMETSFRRIELHADAQEYAAQQQARRRRVLGLMLAVLTIMAAIYYVTNVYAPKALPYAPLMSLAAMALLALPVAIWNNPRVGVYVMAMSACLFKQAPIDIERDPFSRVPVFWNLSTIGQVYGKTNALEFAHFNIGELVILTTIIAWLVRQITLKELRFNRGAFFGW